ncbi:helix-turn-helix transcriptional regulator [Streptomyces sp. NPDC048202]|uniref:helix-turn-helix domain-containing protein n=1 Tax=Streptomyces sp. NPDC048202 TaxID=3365514 RepID=UPI0037201BBC
MNGDGAPKAGAQGTALLYGAGGVEGVDISALDTLTPREREVLRVLPIGDGNRALARRLGIAERTVKAHLTSITRKLGLRNRVEATLVSVRWAEQLSSGGTCLNRP